MRLATSRQATKQVCRVCVAAQSTQSSQSRNRHSGLFTPPCLYHLIHFAISSENHARLSRQESRASSDVVLDPPSKSSQDAVRYCTSALVPFPRVPRSFTAPALGKHLVPAVPKLPPCALCPGICLDAPAAVQHHDYHHHHRNITYLLCALGPYSLAVMMQLLEYAPTISTRAPIVVP
jgi:hypothetical protein